MSYCQLRQDLDKISAFFLALMAMAEDKHLLKDINTYETMITNTNYKPVVKHTVGKSIEAIREINGTLNINHRQYNLNFKSILEKWAKVLTPDYNLQETHDCLLDICNNIVEDYNEFPIIITNAISITSTIIGFIQNRLKEE